MRMRQYDAPNRSLEVSRSLQNAGSGTSKAGVNERKSIVFADKKTIDHSEASQPKQIFGFFS